MEEKATMIESLFQKTEAWAKTNLELFRLKAIDKSADAISSVTAKIVFYVIILIALFSLNTGLALWIGEMMGKLYYGFFIVAAFYVIIGLIVFFAPGIVKSPVNDAVIIKMLNSKKDEKEVS